MQQLQKLKDDNRKLKERIVVLQQHTQHTELLEERETQIRRLLELKKQFNPERVRALEEKVAKYKRKLKQRTEADEAGIQQRILAKTEEYVHRLSIIEMQYEAERRQVESLQRENTDLYERLEELEL